MAGKRGGQERAGSAACMVLGLMNDPLAGDRQTSLPFGGIRRGGGEREDLNPGGGGEPQAPTACYLWVAERIRVNSCCLERNCSFNQRGMREEQRSLFFSFETIWVNSRWISEKNHTVCIAGPLGKTEECDCA